VVISAVLRSHLWMPYGTSKIIPVFITASPINPVHIFTKFFLKQIFTVTVGGGVAQGVTYTGTISDILCFQHLSFNNS
jgi:hypothetical protein